MQANWLCNDRGWPLQIIFVAIALLMGCGRERAKPRTADTLPASEVLDESHVAKVTVRADGQILLDGESVTLEQVKEALAELKRQHGVVWYHRENPASEPHPIASEVMDAVIDSALPVRLFVKPDFSDSFTPGAK